MSPTKIVRRAKEAGLDIIAITDHNMVENGKYAAEIGKKEAISVLFGMELQTEEEIHMIVLFEKYDTALALQETIYNLLPDVPNDPDFFGDQVVVDCDENIVRFEDRLLINSAGISIEEATEWVKDHGGIAIPSHIDSTTFSIISQLGFVPPDIPFDALEIRDPRNIQEISNLVIRKDLAFVTFSDAHYLEDIGKRRTTLNLNNTSTGEIERALKELAHTSNVSWAPGGKGHNLS